MAPPAESLTEGRRRDRPTTDQDRARCREVRVRLEQPDQLGRHEREERDVPGDEGARHLLGVEAVEEHGGGPVDDRAQDDREAGDVAQGQAAEPAVGRIDADVEGGADRAEQEVPVGQTDRARLARGAAGEDAALEVIHVVLAEQGQVGLGLGELGGIVQVDGRPLCGEDAGSLGLGESRAQRQRDGTELHQGMQQHDLLAARMHGERRDRIPPHPVGSEPTSDPGRLGLQLRVGDAGGFGDQRAPLGAAVSTLREPVVELHVRKRKRREGARGCEGAPPGATRFTSEEQPD